MAALLYLKHVYALSDEDVVERWCENPYWQHFSGERYFRHELPCDPSSLVRWRQRIGEEGCEWLLSHTIEAARYFVGKDNPIVEAQVATSFVSIEQDRTNAPEDVLGAEGDLKISVLESTDPLGGFPHLGGGLPLQP